MKKKYIIEVDESEVIEYWSEHGVKEIGYQEYNLKSCPNIKVKPYEERPQGMWIDHSEDEGYVECPVCNCLTNCVDNIDELHYCWNCGAYMRKAVRNE